ncbi:hypothetical protein [Salicibibacter kimchii]|uniref:hypothetical protein n=1 Tax=Salicibibacter kimchii TaxID=2099786 RepID=UPI00135BAE47|nr:hypothetical protein [Salicibibacter kimchii]
MTDGEIAHLIDTEHGGIYAYPLPESERGELTKEMKAIKENFKKRHPDVTPRER